MRTSVYIGTSLDGFIAKTGGDIDWLTQFQNPEVHRDYEEFISRIDAMVIGKGTYEKVLTFPEWPYTKMVFILSSSIKQLPVSLNSKAEIVSMDPKSLLHLVSGRGFSRLYIDGGKVIQSFLREDCIDEMIITKVPLLIGSGIPLFGGLEKDISFNHIKTRVLSNGLVKSYYERIRQ